MVRPASCRMRACGLLAIALFALAASCGDDDDAIAPQPASGLIEGQLLGPDGPLGATVSAIREHAGYGERPWAEAATDSIGRYGLPVAFGRYRLRVSLSSGGEAWIAEGGLQGTNEALYEVGPDRPHLVVDAKAGGVELRLLHEGETFAGLTAQVVALDGRTSTRESSGEPVSGGMRYRFPAVPAGWAAARVAIGTSTWGVRSLPLAGDAAGPLRLWVTPGEWTVATYTLPAPARLVGRVRGSWEELERVFASPSIFRPTARLVRPDGYSPWRTGTVPAGGTYSFEWYPGDSVFVEIEIDGEVRRLGVLSSGSLRPWILQPGTTLDLPEVVESGILMRVFYPAGARWLYAVVDAYDESGVLAGSSEHPCGGAASCTFPERSLAGIANLDPGRYRLRVRPTGNDSGWSPTWYPGTDSLGAAWVEVPPDGGLLRLECSIPPAPAPGKRGN